MKRIAVIAAVLLISAARADHAATKSELAVGERVVVKMSADGKSAATVKMSPAKKTK